MGTVGILAGFNSHSTKEQYHIARDIISPPAELLAQILPGLDNLIALHNHPDSAIEHSVTARGTLRALAYLRKVFLQDSVFLREREGWSHLTAMWNHPIFSRSDYLLYAEQLVAACSAPEVVNPSAYRIASIRENTSTHICSRSEPTSPISITLLPIVLP